MADEQKDEGQFEELEMPTAQVAQNPFKSGELPVAEQEGIKTPFVFDTVNRTIRQIPTEHTYVFLGTSPNARMTISAQQTIANTTQTTVNFNTATFASGITADTASKKFTILFTGIYFVQATVLWDSNASGVLYQVKIIKNTSTDTEMLNYVPGGAVSQSCTASGLISLVTGDTVRVDVYQASGGNDTIGVSGTSFSIHKV